MPFNRALWIFAIYHLAIPMKKTVIILLFILTIALAFIYIRQRAGEVGNANVSEVTSDVAGKEAGRAGESQNLGIYFFPSVTTTDIITGPARPIGEATATQNGEEPQKSEPGEGSRPEPGIKMSRFFQEAGTISAIEKSELSSLAHPNIKIKIIKPPRGEEPDWVNQAWVGLEIPVMKGNYEQKGGQEVISGAYREYDNYIVPLELALAILKEKNPEAEKWWRENAKLAGVFGIGFDQDVCELIGKGE